MRDVAIVGVGSTQFGRAQWSLLRMMCEASHDAIVDAGLGERKIGRVAFRVSRSLRTERSPGRPITSIENPPLRTTSLRSGNIG